MDNMKGRGIRLKESDESQYIVEGSHEKTEKRGWWGGGSMQREI
jgi:hypothetical protein